MGSKRDHRSNGAAARLYLLTFLAAAAVTWIALSVSGERASAADAVGGQPGSIVVRNATDNDLARVRGALDTFSAAGLELPTIEIRFSNDRVQCDGHDGLFQTRFEPWRLSVCSERAYVLIHEMAHAWIEADTTEFTRRRFMSLRDIPRWNDRDDSWSDRGVEDAAFIIQTNLMTPTPPSQSKRWIERRDAFELLTGRPSPMDLPRPTKAVN